MRTFIKDGIVIHLSDIDTQELEQTGYVVDVNAGYIIAVVGDGDDDWFVGKITDFNSIKLNAYNAFENEE